MKSIHDIPAMDRPREKLHRRGPRALADQELLAILLGSGSRGEDVLRVAARILKALDSGAVDPQAADLQTIKGVGPAKAAVIAAALEFARRRIRPEGVTITEPPAVLPLIRHYADRKQEHFLCISLSGAKEVIATRVVSIGLVDQAPVHPREVFADPIVDRAAAVIVAHNHPGGSLAPSEQDLAMTRRLATAGNTLGIELLDHIIFNARGYYSFKAHHQI
jgi:DNA repair protein RadC